LLLPGGYNAARPACLPPLCELLDPGFPLPAEYAPMNESSVQGVVHLIEETKTYGQKGFRKRLVVLEQEDGRFTNFVPLDFVQEGCDSVDRLKVGDRIEVFYRLKGRRWQKDPGSEVKFFLNAEATRFKALGPGGSDDNGSEGPPYDEGTYDDDPPF
jgi:hypothetical protein